MAQQDINKNRAISFKRVLFVKGLNGLMKIASSEPLNEDCGKIIEEFVPPTPSLKTTELKVINGVSCFHSTGVSSYKIELKVLFNTKLLYLDFITNIKNDFIYFDESGSIYNCVVMGEPAIERVEGGRRYIVKITLQGIRKNKFSEDYYVEFSDISNSPFKEDINDLVKCNLISTVNQMGDYIYVFRPGNGLKRSECATLLNRLRKYIQKMME